MDLQALKDRHKAFKNTIQVKLYMRSETKERLAEAAAYVGISASMLADLIIETHLPEFGPTDKDALRPATSDGDRPSDTEDPNDTFV